MKQTKERYIELDLIRVVCCIAVLLYHLGILAGGFFAVCAFFVLSGYLGVRSAFGQERFNILRYWVKRIWRVYVPLLAVALITVGVVTLLPQISWLNLKPETTSVLLGYNNFWQISASQDYFARHGDSPFIHFWFIAILLQFELVFPLVFVVLKFIGKKISRALACILPLAVCAASFLFFYQLLGEGRMTEAYYHSMARAFAPFLGVAVGFIEEYAGPLVPKPFRKGAARGTVLLLYLAVFVYINIALDSGFKYLAWAFLAVTVISARLACYACVRTKTAHGRLSGSSALAFIADSSYEIYLVQYPFIFLLGELFTGRMSPAALKALTAAATLAAAFLMHFGFSYRKGKKPAGLKIAMLAAVLLLTAAGGYCFSVAKDHTQEMAELEQKLEENAREMEARQKAMAEQSRNEEDKWAETLASFDGGEEKILQAVKEMRLTGIGDSVMLNALDKLAGVFPNGWFDAQKSRTAWVLPGIVRDLKNKGMLGDVVVICFGANG
ncbi:MAG: acyltransferase, partial [Firmicutes bacterium]|nr:acyltransferase [Bacillota bacterium]